MPDKKLKLPAEIAKNAGMAAISPALPVVDTGIRATSEIAQAKIEANAKVEVAKLQVWKEAIAATRGCLKVLESYNELQSTRSEWEGRVRVAETAAKEAETNLLIAREQNKPQLEALEQSRKEQERLLSLFDEIMKRVTNADLSDDIKKEALQHLLNLSDKIVQLKKYGITK